MLYTLLAISPRNNDPLALKQGRALAIVMLLFFVISSVLGCLNLIVRDLPALYNTVIGLGLFGAVYVVNRSGRVRAAVSLLLGGGVLVTITAAVIVGRPIPTLYFLGLIVVVAAAFGRPHTPLLWAMVLSCQPFVINLLLYHSLLAPTTPIPLLDEMTIPSLFIQELYAIALYWMLAGTACLASQLLYQMLNESSACARKYHSRAITRPGVRLVAVSIS